jgi:hypothetical protein
VKPLMVVIAAAFVAAASFAQAARAEPTRLAQADADLRRGALPRSPGVLIEEPRPPAVAIETEGRGGHERRDCPSVAANERRDASKVTRTERRCE